MTVSNRKTPQVLWIYIAEVETRLANSVTSARSSKERRHTGAVKIDTACIYMKLTKFKRHYVMCFLVITVSHISNYRSPVYKSYPIESRFFVISYK